MNVHKPTVHTAPAVVAGTLSPELSRSIALQILKTIEKVQVTLSDGFQVTDFMSLFSALSEGAPAMATLAQTDKVGKLLIAGEMFDLITGSDETALVSNFIPGLDSDEEEVLLDYLKTIIINRLSRLL